MIVDISYQNTDDIDNRVTVIRVEKSSKSDCLFDVETLKNICSDLSMSFDSMGDEFYEDFFNDFISNAKADDICQVEISWKAIQAKILSQSLPEKK
jgi:hypothetical protein